MVNERIIKGMADILWGSAWADHVEDTSCQSLSGCEITSCMPEIPEGVFRNCERMLGYIEGINGASAIQLIIRAAVADGLLSDVEDDVWEIITPAYQERFGDCLMHMAMGSGVSWFDDHKKFDIKVPDIASEYECNWKYYAEKHCDECKASEHKCVDCDKMAPGERKYCSDHAYKG